MATTDIKTIPALVVKNAPTEEAPAAAFAVPATAVLAAAVVWAKVFD